MALGEEVLPASELAVVNKKFRELHRLLGKKMMEAQILKEAEKFSETENRLRTHPGCPGTTSYRDMLGHWRVACATDR